MTIVEACRKVSAFSSMEEDGDMFLSRSHAYFYQVQTEMHVTNFNSCDFVVWSPLHQPFVQQVSYDPEFMKTSIMKAQKFYFDQYLPAVLSYIILPPEIVTSSSSSVSLVQQSSPSNPSMSAAVQEKDIAMVSVERSNNSKVETAVLSGKQPVVPANQPVQSKELWVSAKSASPNIQILAIRRTDSLSLICHATATCGKACGEG